MVAVQYHFDWRCISADVRLRFACLLFGLFYTYLSQTLLGIIHDLAASTSPISLVGACSQHVAIELANLCLIFIRLVCYLHNDVILLFLA